MSRSLFKVGAKNTNWMSFGKPKKSMSTRKVVKGLLKEWNFDEGKFKKKFLHPELVSDAEVEEAKEKEEFQNYLEEIYPNRK